MIEIKDLYFSYGKNKVFENFGLLIPEGQTCLVTGINGVGKSTLLRLIAGVLRPKEGLILFDEELGDDPRRKIGFISDALSLYESLTVRQAVDFHRSVYNLVSFDDSLIRHTKISDNQKIKELSVGQRTILHLSLILSTEPEILLIDEIIHSIDAYLRRIFLEQLVKLMTERHITVVMVNLNFHDIEHLVERVILLKSGQIVVDEEIETLKARVKKIVADEPPDKMNILSKINFSDHSEFYVYPYDEKKSRTQNKQVIDLNLTEIISAFIGGEYA